MTAPSTAVKRVRESAPPREPGMLNTPGSFGVAMSARRALEANPIPEAATHSRATFAQFMRYHSLKHPHQHSPTTGPVPNCETSREGFQRTWHASRGMDRRFAHKKQIVVFLLPLIIRYLSHRIVTKEGTQRNTPIENKQKGEMKRLKSRKTLFFCFLFKFSFLQIFFPLASCNISMASFFPFANA